MDSIELTVKVPISEEFEVTIGDCTDNSDWAVIRVKSLIGMEGSEIYLPKDKLNKLIEGLSIFAQHIKK